MVSAPRVRIQVEAADAVERPCDVLVLKYAQHAYGLDRSVLARLGANGPSTLPGPGEHIMLRHPFGIAATALVLLGTRELAEFGYREIREFGKRAVEVVALGLPDFRELCFTLHGAGFGLDEREAFRAQVAGVLDGLTTMPSAAKLSIVTFLEWDDRRAERLTEALAELETATSAPSTGMLTASTLRPEAAERLRTAGLDSDDRPHAFVAMPFGEAFDDVFHYAITRPVENAGLLCERMDRSVFTGDVVETMKRRIREAQVVVADLSGSNPNVYLEVGFAWAAGVPTVLLCDGDSDPHFDVRGHRYLRYRSIREAERQLARELALLVPRDGRAR